MTQAAVVLVPATERGRSGGGRRGGPLGAAANLRAALGAGFAEVLAVLADERMAASLPEEATLLLDEAAAPDEASALRVAIDYCARAGHDAVVVALFAAAALDAASWSALAGAGGAPVRTGKTLRGSVGVVRLDATVWSLLPLEGRVEVLWRARPELAADVVLDASR